MTDAESTQPRPRAVDRAAARDWVAGYERAWRTAGTDGLGELFASEATYQPAPFAEPIRGLGPIAAMWEAERAGPDEPFTMTSEVVAVEGDTAVIRVEVQYGPPRHTLYRDLWIVRFDAHGRCAAFEEWPFWPPGTAGSIAQPAGASSR
jgi:hypothetical protein